MTRFTRARDGFAPMVRDLILMRDRYACVMCGQRRQLRVVRRTRDATEAGTAAGITLCAGIGSHMCAEHVTNNHNAAVSDGYLVPEGQDPAATPFPHASHGYVALDNKGGINSRTRGTPR